MHDLRPVCPCREAVDGDFLPIAVQVVFAKVNVSFVIDRSAAAKYTKSTAQARALDDVSVCEYSNPISERDKQAAVGPSEDVVENAAGKALPQPGSRYCSPQAGHRKR